MPWADSLVSCLRLGPDPKVCTEGEAWSCPTAWLLHHGWRSAPAPSSAAGCGASFVAHKGYGGNGLRMWQQLSGAKWAVQVESSAGAHRCEVCHSIGRLCSSPWPRAIQKLAKNIIRRCSSNSNMSICTFEQDIYLLKGHFLVLRGFCVSLLHWLPTYPDPHRTSSAE